jgi:GalNAc-alpha-(1->4)-GalNAc-alpha-(1->3)-diNAcBac-PP-undecaprenol alpha-1,4-N-acetyl-D-galactosaminyltransferase
MNKKILIVVSAMNMGGAQRVVSILSDYWAKKGYKVSLITTYTGNKEEHYSINKDINLTRITNNPFFPKVRLLNLFWKLLILRKIIKDLKPDIIFSFLTRINIATSLAIMGLKFHLIICERAWPPFYSLNSSFFWIYRIIFKKAKKVIVQTNESKVWMAKNFPANNTILIPNPIQYPIGIDEQSSIQPDSIVTPYKKIILGSARFHKNKQFDLLIRSFSKIHDKYPEWILVILGDGEEKESLANLVSDLEINDKVIFPGIVGNISAWYERADLFVLSSKMEGFPNVLLEAMSYGLPSISFDCNTGPRDMIQDGINGILVNPEENEAGITNALIKMIEDNNLRKKISRESVLLRDKYSVKNIMQIWDKNLN